MLPRKPSHKHQIKSHPKASSSGLAPTASAQPWFLQSPLKIFNPKEHPPQKATQNISLAPLGPWFASTWIGNRLASQVPITSWWRPVAISFWFPFPHPQPGAMAPLLWRTIFSFSSNNSLWRLPPDDFLPKVTRSVWSQHRAAPKKSSWALAALLGVYLIRKPTDIYS